ncbi:MAG: hypothetical protein AAGK37_21880 [Pseudomonadota bacterium]
MSYDDLMGHDAGPKKFASEAHKAAYEQDRDDAARAARMYQNETSDPNYGRPVKRADGTIDHFPVMARQRADAERLAKAQFEANMLTRNGANARQAARDKIDDLITKSIAFPSHADDIADQIEEIEEKFGDWLHVD